MLAPVVLQSTAQQHQVVAAQRLDGVAHDASCTLAVFHKVQFHLLVLVQGIGEGLFVSVYQIEEIVIRQR